MNKSPNIENLKPFKKGADSRRNLKGRPKLPDLKEAIAKVLNETQDDETALEKILKALRSKAAKGDVRAAQELMDRGYGKSKQIFEDTGGQKIIIEINEIKK